MSFPAHHTRGAIHRNERPSDRRVFIPESDASPGQIECDYENMAALIVDRLIVKYPHTGEMKGTDTYFAPHLQRLEAIDDHGIHEYQIVGGWVTKEQARVLVEEDPFGVLSRLAVDLQVEKEA